MHVLRGVGIAVVCAVVHGPPDGPAMATGGHHHGQHELEGAAGLEGVVREVAVRAALKSKDTQEVADDGGNQQLGGEGHEEHAQAGQVRNPDARPHDVVALCVLDAGVVHCSPYRFRWAGGACRGL